jgi:hypothetical protein
VGTLTDKIKKRLNLCVTVERVKYPKPGFVMILPHCKLWESTVESSSVCCLVPGFVMVFI